MPGSLIYDQFFVRDEKKNKKVLIEGIWSVECRYAGVDKKVQKSRTQLKILTFVYFAF